MKVILAALLLAACLAYGVPAQAYAIYNDSSYTACWSEGYISYFYCKKTSGSLIAPNGTHNGCHNCSAKITISYKDNNGDCWYSPEAHIPKGGFLRVYNDRVELWRHCDNCTPNDRRHTYGYKKGKCFQSPFL